MPKIYTKTGDTGETSTLLGDRVKKNCIEMDAIGEIDELNSIIGVIVSKLKNNFDTEKNNLIKIQNHLFIIDSQLASLQTELKGLKKIEEEDVIYLEKWIDTMEDELPELKNFILFNGTEEASLSFYARSICRRAERRIVDLSEKNNVNENIKKYINRLSDVLFVFGRWLNKKDGVGDVVLKNDD